MNSALQLKRDFAWPKLSAPAWELTALLATLCVFLWTDSRIVAPKPARSATAVMVVIVAGALFARSRPTKAELGWAPASWRAGVAELAFATLAAMVLLALVGWRIGSIGAVERFDRWVLRNWYLEGAQQLVLQILLVPRLDRLLEDRGPRVFTVAAVLFSLIHAPNWPLMLLTAPAGYFWVQWFARYRNFPAVWLSHLLLGATTLYCLNGPFLRQMRVGVSYVFFGVG